MNKEIPFLDLNPQNERLWPDLKNAVESVIKSGQYINGPWVREFEIEVEKYTQAKRAVALNSGTDALFIGLRALGVKEGDEVITTPFSFFATAEAVCQIGAIPVFVDIEPETFNIDTSKIEEKITSKTKAIIPVHLFGHPSEMRTIYNIAKKHDLVVIEDAAQGFGCEYEDKKIGMQGDMTTFSFFPTKNLGAFGDGGMLVTNHNSAADLSLKLRAHGGKDKYFNEYFGYNSRLDSLQAAILLIKLKEIEFCNQARRDAAKRYNDLIKHEDIINPIEKTNCKHIYHQYTLRIKNGKRDKVSNYLKNQGIPTMVYYPTPIHKLPVFQNAGYPQFIEAEKAASEVLSLPLWPEITLDLQQKIASQLIDSFSK
jgi:dTDP-4-amino-4,6-dideoxygalactose transaminase